MDAMKLAEIFGVEMEQWMGLHHVVTAIEDQKSALLNRAIAAERDRDDLLSAGDAANRWGALLDRLADAYCVPDVERGGLVHGRYEKAVEQAINAKASNGGGQAEQDWQAEKACAADIIANAFIRSGPPPGLRLGVSREQVLRTMLREAQDEILALRLAAAESA